MSSKVLSIGIQIHTKMIQHYVHIRSTDQFKQVGVHENKSAKWHCGRHTLICKKILIKKT